MEINRFRGEYEYLSNFFIEPDGTCVEKEFQAAKCRRKQDAEAILRVRTPGDAKRAGRLVSIRYDWEEVKIDIMRMLVSRKFHDHANLAAKLMETHPHEIIEGNNWGDTFWGVCNGIGYNWLGLILEGVRRDLLGGQ